jgi:hypothetical protein
VLLKGLWEGWEIDIKLDLENLQECARLEKLVGDGKLTYRRKLQKGFM